MLHSLFANLHFHCCLALIGLIFINLVLQYFRRGYVQNFAHHHNTASVVKKKRVCTQSVFLFTYIYYNILQHYLTPTVVCFEWTNIQLYFFKRCVHSNIKKSRRTSYLIRHNVLAVSLRFIQFVSQFYQ